MILRNSTLSTITAGGTSQLIAKQKRGRVVLFFQNTSAEDMWVNFNKDASAASPSIKVLAGESLPFVSGFAPDGDVYVYAATTSSTFTYWEG